LDNPWIKLRNTAGIYILESDREQILRYNARRRDSTELVLKSVPEPFIGNPNKATLILLLLNPGHSPDDPKAHSDPAFKKTLLRNLQHQETDFPFYPLNSAFSGTPTAQWWIPRTRKLKEAAEISDAELSEKLMAIEWFPYHSKSSGLPENIICDSQRYSFHLVKQMLDNGKLVVRMRSKRHWQGVDQRTLQHALKNPRSSYISKNNSAGELFDHMVEALRS